MTGREPRRWLSSARARILVAYVAVLALSALLALVGVRHLLITRTAQHVDDTLDAHVDRFLHYQRQQPGERNRDWLRKVFDEYLDDVNLQEDETFVALVKGRPHRVVSALELDASHAAKLAAIPVSTRRVSGELDSPNGNMHYVVAPIRAEGRRIGRLAVTLLADDEWIDAPLTLAFGVVTAWLLLGSIIAFVISGRVLSPLRTLADTASAINESDLTRRIPAKGHDEVAELARTFNAMLDRLEATFEAQRNFTSDAGHNLRTPLTIIRGHLELIPEDPQERATTIALVTDELDRMSRLVNDLLVMARSGRPDFLMVEPLDLHDLAQELYSKATALAPREWRLVGATPGRIVADRQRLTDAVLNLAENAVRSTKEDEAIEIGATMEGKQARIWVRDGGVGIEPEEQERIFERFTSGHIGTAGRRDGTGLGLAIVRAVAEAHGGTVQVRSRPGLGALFEILLPVEPDGGYL